MFLDHGFDELSFEESVKALSINDNGYFPLHGVGEDADVLGVDTGDLHHAMVVGCGNEVQWATHPAQYHTT